VESLQETTQGERSNRRRKSKKQTVEAINQAEMEWVEEDRREREYRGE
jgi:hypothetical protein